MLIMGRIIDEDLIDKIRNQTKVNFSLIHFSDKNKTPNHDYHRLWTGLSESSFYIEYKDDKNLTVYSYYPDVIDRNTFIISAQKQGKIIEKGFQTIQNAIGSLLISLLILLIVILLLINRIVVKPVFDLTHHIKTILKTWDLTKRIKYDLSDEIGELTAQYNQMLEELHSKQEKLELAAITDGLTGLYNHRYILERLNHETEKALRYGLELAVFMLDVDRFKRINDTYGHTIGDDVLVKISLTIQNEVRYSDLAGRYGGEEFLVVLPVQNRRGAFVVAERVRQAIEQLLWQNDELRATISGGIGALGSGNNSNVSIIAEADKNLYKAKNNGRNNIAL